MAQVVGHIYDLRLQVLVLISAKIGQKSRPLEQRNVI